MPPSKQLPPTGNLAPSSKVAGVVKNVSDKVAKVFGSDDEDDTEEMPFEARMKMRNIGRFGKKNNIIKIKSIVNI